jgi:N-acetylmuramoyl-L-alanine amidase
MSAVPADVFPAAPARGIQLLIIHCAATPNGSPFTIEDIDRWHVANGWGRQPSARAAHRPHLLAVGYHYVIDIAGIPHEGRALYEVGAHAAGHNAHSIGLCLIGTDKFLPAQWDSLRQSVLGLRMPYPALQVIGHRDVNPGKTCPGFDVSEWLAGGMAPLEGHVL